jgi:hAT family C-terminal dimerisation region
MATTSAASERNFSTFGFIHSKLRNSLAAEKVIKLVFIKTNYPVFAETLVEYSDDEFSSDPENEEVEINETQ